MSDGGSSRPSVHETAVDLLREAVQLDATPARLTVRGGSMLPLLHDGDEAEIDRAGVPRLGAILVVQRHDELICHRFVGRRREGSFLMTAGDLGRALEILPVEALVGRVVAIRRAGSGVLVGRGVFVLEPMLGGLLRASLELRSRPHPLRFLGWGVEILRRGVLLVANALA